MKQKQKKILLLPEREGGRERKRERKREEKEKRDKERLWVYYMIPETTFIMGTIVDLVF